MANCLNLFLVFKTLVNLTRNILTNTLIISTIGVQKNNRVLGIKVFNNQTRAEIRQILTIRSQLTVQHSNLTSHCALSIYISI